MRKGETEKEQVKGTAELVRVYENFTQLENKKRFLQS